jgi:hypothetical protein
MADERDKESFDSTEHEDKQQATGGQQSHESEFGRQGQKPAEAEGQQSETEGEGFILQQGAEDEAADEEGAGPRDVGSGGPGSSV